jgi:hypothetical protein
LEESTVGVSVMRTTYAGAPGLNSRGPYDLDHWERPPESNFPARH